MQMGKDLHNNVGIESHGINAVAVGTTGTGKTTGAVDRAGYGGIEFIISYGAITATNAVFTALMTESDTTNGSFTSVADADMLGTEALAGVAAAASRTDGTSKNVTKKLGYKGDKRYVKVKVSSTVTAGTPIAIVPVLHNPRHAPVS